MMGNKIIRMLATGLGIGYSPILPGTLGTLWGIPLAWGVSLLPGIALQSSVCLALTSVAVPICGRAAKMSNQRDPSSIVADEYMTLPICFLALPFTPQVVASGFVLHRIFDISKPPPIRNLEHLHGGFGIVLDDLLAALFALLCNHLLFQFFYS